MFFKILISAIFKKYLQFFQVFNLFEFFTIFSGTRDLFQRLMISCRIVSRVNGIVIYILMTPVLSIFLNKIYFFFQIFENYYVPSLWIFMSQWNYLMLEIGTLVSLLRQQNGFEDFNTLNRSKIVKICYCFQNFWIFLSFSRSVLANDVFWSLPEGTWHTSRAKNGFQLFHCEFWKLFF